MVVDGSMNSRGIQRCVRWFLPLAGPPGPLLPNGRGAVLLGKKSLSKLDALVLASIGAVGAAAAPRALLGSVAERADPSVRGHGGAAGRGVRAARRREVPELLISVHEIGRGRRRCRLQRKRQKNSA